MGLFCLPLSSCYTMVDIYLEGTQLDSPSDNHAIQHHLPNSSIISGKGHNFSCFDNSTNSCMTNSELLPFAEAVTESGQSSLYMFDDVQAYWFQVIWICVFHNIFIVVGLVGNLLNIIILSKHGIGADSTNILLLTLSAIDTMMLLSNGVQNMTCFTCHLQPATAISVDTNTNIYLTSPSRWISFVNLDITALIAIERAIAVFFPFSVGKLFNRKTILVIYSIITLIIILVLTPHMIGVRPRVEWDANLNQSVAITFMFVGNFNNFLIFWSLIENVNAFGCVIVIFVCCTATAIKLIHQSRSRTFMTNSRKSPAAARQERRAVTMLLIICFISFLVHLPNSSNQLYSSLFLEQLAKDGMYCALRALGSFLGSLNASVNFFIYFFMSTKFKETYKLLFCWGGKKNAVETS